MSYCVLLLFARSRCRVYMSWYIDYTLFWEKVCRVHVCCSMFMLGLRQKRMELRQAGPFMCFSKIKQANIFSGIHVQRAEIGTWENCCAFALTRWPRHLDQSIKWLSSHQTCPPCDACGFNLGLILVLLEFVWILQGLIWPLFCLDWVMWRFWRGLI